LRKNEVRDVQRDQIVGSGLLIISVIVIIAYAYILYATSYDIALLKLTGLIAVAGVFGILGWIGYTLATTPPPKPIEEIEKELEKELEKIDKEIESEKQDNSSGEETGGTKVSSDEKESENKEE
jgi:predicted DNA-binding transcriptional regulator